MILVTSKETGLPAYIWVSEITQVESHKGSPPYSRVYLKCEKQRHEYTLDVLESAIEISKRIKHERLICGRDVYEE